MRSGALWVLAAVLPLALVGCTPTTAPPSTSPTPTITPSPPEPPVVREQRLAYAAAKKVYTEASRESNRLFQLGKEQPSSYLRARSAGPYLKLQAGALNEFHGAGYRVVGNIVIESFRETGYSTSELGLVTCEDGRKSRIVDRKGALISKGNRGLTDITMRKLGGAWKVWSYKEETKSGC